MKSKLFIFFLCFFSYSSFASLSFSSFVKNADGSLKYDITFKETYDACTSVGMRVPTMRELLSVTEKSGGKIKDHCNYPREEFTCFSGIGGTNLYTGEEDYFAWNANSFVANSRKFAGKRVWTSTYDNAGSSNARDRKYGWVQLGHRYENKKPVKGDLSNLPSWFWDNSKSIGNSPIYGVCVSGNL